MKVAYVDLQGKSTQIIGVLSRNERVTVLYRGKPIAIMTPVAADTIPTKARDHAAFGLWAHRRDLAEPVAHARTLRQAQRAANPSAQVAALGVLRGICPRPEGPHYHDEPNG